MTDSTQQQPGGSASSSQPDRRAAYLAGVAPEQAQQLAAVNKPGLRALRSYLGSGHAVAFLGAGSSAPLYPLWGGVIAELIDAAAEWGLQEDAAATCHAMAGDRPDAVVELLRRQLGAPRYQAVLREVFRVRRDPTTGWTWTPTQELVCRCPFKAVVTTNYDPGVVDARMRVRPRASSTGFTSWTDELALDRWRTDEVFGDQELPVLFAHGHHNQPDAMVLATTEYRRAYAGKLSEVLSRMVDAWHLVWVGFSFADQHINGVLREVANHTGTEVDPGGAPRHVLGAGRRARPRPATAPRPAAPAAPARPAATTRRRGDPGRAAGPRRARPRRVPPAPANPPGDHQPDLTRASSRAHPRCRVSAQPLSLANSSGRSASYCCTMGPSIGS
jgi:hypothetical protein